MAQLLPSYPVENVEYKDNEWVYQYVPLDSYVFPLEVPHAFYLAMTGTGTEACCVTLHNGVTVTVDWGDGTTSTLSGEPVAADLLHTYETAGVYTVRMSCDNWENVQYNPRVTHEASAGFSLYNRAWLSKIPKLHADSTFSFMNYDSSFLQYIPSGFFDNNPDITDFSYVFAYTGSLQHIPEDLFAKHTKVTTFAYAFNQCGLTTNKVCADGTPYFALDIGSDVVTNVEMFYSGRTIDTVYVNVPAGSTTESTMQASSLFAVNTTPCSD